MNLLPSNYLSIYKSEVQKRLNPISDTSVVSPEDIIQLPLPVQKYLNYVGAVGKPKVKNFRLVFSGSMKREKNSNWMNISSRQYNFFNEPARLFYIHSKVFGIPFDGLHVYAGTTATMQIRVASLFRIVDAKGDKMNQGETVTLFNDMCLMAPATLISMNIQWESIDELTVRAKFTNKHITISALLSFNEKGELTNFTSDDRYYSLDGKTYLSYPWSTPVRDYQEIDGRKVPAYGEAVWLLPERAYCYARFDLKEIEYNCGEYKEK
jgi:hypothetical protein